MRRIVPVLLKTAVSALLLFLALRSVDIRTVATRFYQLNLMWAFPVLALMFFQNFLQSLRWRQILQRCGAHLPIWKTFRFGMIGIFFNQTLPSSIGGDAIRLWLVGKETD